MKRGSAVVVGSKDESDAILLYKTLLSKNQAVKISIMMSKCYKIQFFDLNIETNYKKYD